MRKNAGVFNNAQNTFFVKKREQINMPDFLITNMCRIVYFFAGKKGKKQKQKDKTKYPAVFKNIQGGKVKEKG